MGVNWRRVTTLEKGEFPKLFVFHLSISCNHCKRLVCALACPVNAITKRKEDGIVVIDSKKCLGKNKCVMLCKKSCPYSAPQFGTEDNAKMLASSINSLKSKYSHFWRAEGFLFYKKIKPSIILKKN